MQFPKAPAQYDAVHQAQVQRIIETEDLKAIKTGQILDRLLFRDTSTNTVRTVVITAGAFVIT